MRSRDREDLQLQSRVAIFPAAEYLKARLGQLYAPPSWTLTWFTYGETIALSETWPTTLTYLTTPPYLRALSRVKTLVLGQSEDGLDEHA